MDLPSLSETRDFLVAMFRALFSDRNVGNKRSFHGRRLTVVSAGITQISRHAESALKGAIPSTAGDDAEFAEWAVNVMGVERKPASSARRASALRVFGDNGATVSTDDILIHKASGETYRLTASIVIPDVAPNNFVNADVVAIGTGAKTRLDVGEVLEFDDTPPANIEEQATLVLDLNEDGTDEEPFGAWRKRVLDAIAIPASGGNQDDWVKWALEIPDIGQAFAYINRAGFGTVDLVFLHSATRSARIPDSGTITDALAYVKAKAPGHFSVEDSALRALTPIEDPVEIEMLITPDGRVENAFHWDDTIPPVVVAWTLATKQLQMTTDGAAAIPVSMKAGHTIVLRGVASEQNGTEFKIEAIISADTIQLEEAPFADPEPTDQIYSGGPLTTPIRDAIVGHVNGQTVYAARGRVPKSEATLADDDESSVGLEIVAEGIGPANPAGAYGPWNGSLLRQQLSLIATWKGGVRNVTIVTPAADYDAEDFTFPNDDEIGLLTPAVVLIRRG